MGGAGRRAGLAPGSGPARPGRRGRSVGAARRAHPAGSHPSARRGCTLGAGAGAARPGRADRAGGRGAGAASALRPSSARRASCSGDEEPSAHPAQNAAAAGRLHCLTTTRAGFSPRPADPIETSLWEIRELLPQDPERSLE
nr:zinc finger protein 664 isoform X2 [Equus asinus]